MKKILLSLLVVFCLFGCAPKSFEDKLEGTYSFQVMSSDLGTIEYTYVFEKNGNASATITAVKYNQKKTATGKWEYKDGNLVVHLGSDNPTFSVTEKDNEISLSYKGIALEKK